MATDRLLPITSMPILPGDPEDVIIFYGQARSLIQFMVFRYGPQAMRELLSTLKSGTNMEDAIQSIYGISRIELENQWRDTLGADHYVPPDRDSAKPTPIPAPSLQLFSLTPQAGSETVGTIEATPTPEPEPAPAPEPTATEPPAVSQTEDESEPEEIDRRESGTACLAPATPTMRVSDLALPLSVLGLIGLGLRRRRR